MKGVVSRSGGDRQRTVTAAGLVPWPKVWTNLRSTRETELAETYPMHVVCAWIGNSRAIAQEHYLQVTDAHFTEAIKEPSTSAAQNPAQQPAEMGRREQKEGDVQPPQGPESQGVAADCDVTRNVSKSRMTLRDCKAPPRGVEPLFSD